MVPQALRLSRAAVRPLGVGQAARRGLLPARGAVAVSALRKLRRALRPARAPLGVGARRRGAAPAADVRGRMVDRKRRSAPEEPVAAARRRRALAPVARLRPAVHATGDPRRHDGAACGGKPPGPDPAQVDGLAESSGIPARAAARVLREAAAATEPAVAHVQDCCLPAETAYAALLRERGWRLGESAAAQAARGPGRAGRRPGPGRGAPHRPGCAMPSDSSVRNASSTVRPLSRTSASGTSRWKPLVGLGVVGTNTLR